MIKWFQNNRDNVIRNSFLLPILLVVIMSISHVVSWYDLGNPYSWAIYLSVAIEIFAVASVSAASIKMSRGSIWFLFGLVTAIQIIGNIFYEFKDINPIGEGFVSWMELIQPLFEDWDVLDHRRFLAAIQGGTLPLMSLTALHFYIKFNDLKNDTPPDDVTELKEEYTPTSDEVTPVEINDDEVEQFVKEYKEEQNVNTKKNTPGALTATGTGLPVNDIRPNKGNNVTSGLISKEIDSNTGRIPNPQNNKNDNGST